MERREYLFIGPILASLLVIVGLCSVVSSSTPIEVPIKKQKLIEFSKAFRKSI